MPLLSVRCPNAHTTDYLSPKEPRPATCPTCGTDTIDALTAPAPPTVMGYVDGRKARFVREGSTTGTAPRRGHIVEETATTRVLEIGTSLAFVESMWRCPDGHRFPRCDDEKPTAVDCEKCGKPCVEVPLGAVPDWFKERSGGDPNGYWDHGLGVQIRSREHRKQVMAEQGVVEAGEVGDINRLHDDWRRSYNERAAQEDAFMRDYLRSLEHGPDAARIKAERDHAIAADPDNAAVYDWGWAIEALGGI